MNIEEAYREIRGLGLDCGTSNLWEALKMAEMCWNDLGPYTRQAYKVVKNELEKELVNGN